MEGYMTCTKCGYYLHESELVSKTEDADDLDFNYCPHCENDDFEYDDDDEELEAV